MMIGDNHRLNGANLHKVPETLSGPSQELKNTGPYSCFLPLPRTQQILGKTSDRNMNHRPSICTSAL